MLPRLRTRAVQTAPVMALVTAALAVGACLDATPGSSAASSPPAVAATPRADTTLRGPADAPRVASYRLTASLDAVEHRVTARGTIRWLNASRVPAEELYLHLYLNAFSSERTLFLRSPSYRSRSGATLRTPGGLTVQRLSSPSHGGVDLWEDAAPHSPGDPEDTTDIRVPLPAPVPPGETLELEVEFTAQLPSIVERTGFAGSFHMVGQWFPKLARREPDGRWAHFAFHPHAEFYADFGDYDVTLEVPAGFVVGATGQRIEQRVTGERRTERYRAEAVHDFAWAAWDGFEVEERTVGATKITLLAPPHTAPARAATWESLEHALPYLGALYGPYPHPTLTVVHPPSFAAGAGGMEYPTLITTGGSSRWPPLGVRLIEQVTVHELAHQWFQGMLASNEAASPFLDEGLTSYAEWRALRALFGAGSLIDLWGLQVSLEAAGRVAAVGHGQDEIIASPAHAFPSMRTLAAHVYSGTATALSTIAGVYGQARLDAALSDYATTHRFAHPVPDDLLASVARHVGPGAASALRGMLFERATVDYRVAELTSAPQGEDGGWRSRAVIARGGTLQLPVTVRLELIDGQRIDRRWSGVEPVFVVEQEHEAPLARVVVDPEQAVLWDRDLLNNSRSLERQSTLRSSERAWYWAELLLHLLGP